MSDRNGDPLRRQVERLPREVRPQRDLWPDIRSRIAREPRRAPLRARARAATAGVCAVLAAAAAVVVALRGATQPPPSPITVLPMVPARSPSPAPEVRLPGETDYARAAQALASELQERRPSFPSRDVTVLDDNIRILDDAIASTRAALLTHPDDAELRAELDRTWEDKLDLLREATELPTGM
jgi:hypothetical protein